MSDRRRFLQTVGLAAGAALLDWPAWAGVEPDTASRFHRWFPQFPAPRELWVVPFAGDVEEGMVLESAAGLAGLNVLRGNWDALIYEDVPNDGYQRWFVEYCQAHRPKLTRLGLDEAVVRLQRAGVVRGTSCSVLSNPPARCIRRASWMRAPMSPRHWLRRTTA